MKTISDDMRNTCFFCSEKIESKKTLEHIIPNSLLGRLGIKEETITGEGLFQYSKVKVPAHDYCNNGFGSQYENKIINLLDDPESLYEDLINEEDGISTRYTPDDSKTMLISTWLSKIYYGLFYNDYLKIHSIDYKEITKNIIDTDNFRMIQKAYKDGVGFCLPSSLYVFKSNNIFFDLKTFIHPQTIMIKINSLILILCIGDGFLSKNYLNGEKLKNFRNTLQIEEKNNSNFPIHLFSLAEIMSLRMHIPKKPSFVYSKNEILNMSLSTAVKNPEEFYKVDEESIIKKRNEILTEFNVKMENN
ncbi:hypothetical protein [Algibacter lectus]|uniref:HNH endonuclease n=1 Tax=Algibacter lectus TaxID=221126 RepID=A0A090VK89_9FLAO|nr:hypothetical protein [Algibacter lectus]GAL65146.1 hypothetical protein JCM19300_2025 [Algibacter lectus]